MVRREGVASLGVTETSAAGGEAEERGQVVPSPRGSETGEPHVCALSLHVKSPSSLGSTTERCHFVDKTLLVLHLHSKVKELATHCMSPDRHSLQT